MTAMEQKQIQGRMWLARFYVLLSEWLIGLYPDTVALSGGPVKRETLEDKIDQAYQKLIELDALDESALKNVAMDYERVGAIVNQVKSIVRDDEFDFSSEEFARELEKHAHEREYLTKRALEYNAAAHGEA